MPQSSIPSPKTHRELIGEYFIENRNRVLDIAAYLDRLDRADATAADDFRMQAFREALRVLSSGEYPRVEQIHLIMSDPTEEPIPQADSKGASGAFDSSSQRGS